LAQPTPLTEQNIAEGFVIFVAKLQKAKTRKNKDYFVLRATIPKAVAETLDAKAGDYLLFRTKKAQWDSDPIPSQLTVSLRRAEDPASKNRQPMDSQDAQTFH